MEATVAVGMSGGVDSSTAAALLLEQGYHVIGLTMKVWDDTQTEFTGNTGSCYGPGAGNCIPQAKAMCNFLNIEHHIIDISKEFKEEVIHYFTNEYIHGRTPNPCYRCNPSIKFGRFLDAAREQGVQFDYFATGHYAMLQHHHDRTALLKGKDSKKDQTYFLAAIPQERLHKVLFPLGEMTKDQTRHQAKRLKLPVADRAESQDFVHNNNYSILFNNQKILHGPIRNTQGEILGKHHGLIHYTIGQRRGLGISAPHPLYVTNIVPQSNTLYVGEESELLKTCLHANQVNWFTQPQKSFQAKARIRHNHKEQEALITLVDDNEIQVTFNKPQKAITPGQAVVLYQEDQVIAGAIIKKAFNQV